MNVIAFRLRGASMFERIENVAVQITRCDFQEGVPQTLIDTFVALLAEQEEKLRPLIRPERTTPYYWEAAQRLNRSKGREYHDNFVALQSFCYHVVWLQKRAA